MITIGITTYKRPECLNQALDSIKKFCPDIPILVQQTKGNLSWGRNRLVNRCETEYLLIMEDDMVFTENTKIEKLKDVLDSDKEIGGVSCHMIDPIRYLWVQDFNVFREKLEMVAPGLPSRISKKGVIYQPCQITMNFYLIRREMGKQFPWDEELEMAEHQEWFFRIKDHWRFAHVPECSFIHDSKRPEGYKQEYEERVRKFQEAAQRKIGLRYGGQFLHRTVQEGRPNIIMIGDNKQLIDLLGSNGWYVSFKSQHEVHEFNKKAWEDARARQLVNKYLKTPWLIADIAFQNNLHKWIPLLARFEPTLISSEDHGWPWKKSIFDSSILYEYDTKHSSTGSRT